MPDDEGQGLPGIEAAHQEALSALADAIEDVVVLGNTDQHVAVEVRDHRGPVLEVTAILGSKILRKP